ncbi:ATPase inhibitor [Macleaya cordata]|uniref:ATPase inhibitor n=1 Tax=Macleaya cordata TaxID=56857 RepID=A0A200QHS0_MACCD|nr:ATPase inhibitor [Macleaya cordata]
MAMRAIVKKISPARLMEGTRMTPRYFSDGNGRVLGEEEKAAENIYIKKMERERLEKLKLKAEKEKAEAEKAQSEKVWII